jgi:CheY-like chemotaxis protein
VWNLFLYKLNKMGTVEKIMLIDDDAEEFVLFKEAVSRVRKDVEVCYAGGVVDAFTMLEGIKGNLPDLIFLDINMPMHNGRDCLKALGQSKRFSHIPVVMYTVQDLLPEEKGELRVLGASFFLQKPQLKDLVLILRFLLGERQTTADLKDVAKLFVRLA